MTTFDPGPYIRERHANQPSRDDQVTVARVLWEASVVPGGEERTRTEIAALLEERGVEVEHTLRTVLDNLDDLGVVESFYPHDGARWFPISERRDEIVLGEYESTVATDLDRFVAHMREHDRGGGAGSSTVADGGGATIRATLAGTFDVPPGEVEAHLRSGTTNERRRKLVRAIDAVEHHDGVRNGDDYGRVLWRHMALRYQLSEDAVERFVEE